MKNLILYFATACLTVSAMSANLVIGVEAIDYYPVYKSDGAKYEGYARDLLDAFASKAGHQFTYKPLPVARLMNDYLTGDSLDLKFPDNAMWAGDMRKGKSIAYSQAALTVQEGVMVLPENKGKPVSAIKTLGTMRGFTPYPYLDFINKKSMTLAENNSFDALIKTAVTKHVDGIYITSLVGDYYLNEVLKTPNALVFDESLPSTKSGFSLSSIKHPEVVKKFDEFMTKEKELIAKLQAKYKLKGL